MAVAVHSRRRDRKVIRYDSERAQEADQGGVGRQAESQSEEGFDFGQPEESRGREGSGEEIHRRRAGDAPQGEESSAQENSPPRGGEARGGNPPAAPKPAAKAAPRAPSIKTLKAKAPVKPAKAAARKPAPRKSAEPEKAAHEPIRQAAEEGKFYLGAEQRVMPPVEAIDIPKGYNVDRIVAMVRDPHWLFAYWEVTDRKYRELERDLRPDMGVVQDDPPRLRQIERENRATSTSFSRARREPGISAFPPRGATRSRSAPCPPTDGSSSSPSRTSSRRRPTA